MFWPMFILPEWLLLCSHESVLAELTRRLSREEKTVYKLY